ncbi:MAG: hypothetical protein ACOY0T_24125 [Myxococcota bacterium]
MLKRLGRLRRVELPNVATVVARARENGGPNATTQHVLREIDDMIIDLDGESRALPELSSALARVALASGTALALIALASNFGFAALPRAGTCFGVGVVGAMVVSYLGRLASERSRTIRAHWSDVSTRARRQISGESVAPRREKSDPLG